MNRRGFLGASLGGLAALFGLGGVPVKGPLKGPEWKYGQVVVRPKKIACLIKVPNELIHYASSAKEMLLSDHATKELTRRLDLQITGELC